MRKFLLATMAAVGMAAPVQAADMPLKAPPVAAVETYSWTGFYFGVNGGGAWTRERGNYANFAPIQYFNANPRSGIIGGHVGYQRQFSRFVLGVEAGFSGLTRDWNGGINGPSAECLLINATPTTCQARVNRIFTIGPRAGFALMSNVLLYGTGGYANGTIDTRLFDRNVNAVFDTTSQRHSGWFAGVGGEYAIGRYLVLGVEYLHVDFRSRLHPSSADNFNPAEGNARNVAATTDIVRGRLSVKFDGGPVVARY